MKTLKIIIALAIFVPSLIFASYMPRIYLAGFGGYDKALVGKADILAPIYLATDKNLFAYAQGKYGYENETWQDNTWMGSLALGYRQIVKDKVVLGAYVFGDYTASDSGHNFWLVSPGIEAFTRAWEFRANGYFPVSDKRWVDENYAEEFGDFRFVEFEQHKQYDHVYKFYQETGPGVDAEAGRMVYKVKNILFKAYLNGYYYYMQDNDDVTGVGGRLTMEPNRSVKVSLHYSYDNYEHSTFLIGAQLSLYDLFSDNKNAPVDENDLQHRLFIPIERNLGTIGSGSSVPVTQSDTPEDAGRTLVHDNIWFFREEAAASNAPQGTGTYEDPFRAFTMEEFNYINNNFQNIGATIDPFPLMYFNSGTYPLTDFSYRFNLPVGWGMYGWELYNVPVLQPATGNTRPIFEGGIDLKGGNNTLDSITIHNNIGAQNNGLDIMASNIYLNDIKVGALDSVTGYKTGINITDSNHITLNRSQIYGFDAPSNGTAKAYGINLDNSQLTINEGNTISGTAMGGSPSANKANFNVSADAYGLYTNNSTVTLSGNGNTILATATGGTVGSISEPKEIVYADANADGLYAGDGSTVSLSGNGNTISATATGGTIKKIYTSQGNMFAYADAETRGLVATNNSELTLSGNENTISGTAIGGTIGEVDTFFDNVEELSADACAYGLYTYSSIANLSGNKNNVLGIATAKNIEHVSRTGDTQSALEIVHATTEAYGLSATNSLELTLSGNENTISATATGGAIGEVLNTGGELVFISANVDTTARGIKTNNSTVTLSGSENTISAIATGGTIKKVNSSVNLVIAYANANADAKGFDTVGSSSLTLSGNENSASATATGGTIGEVSGPDVIEKNATAQASGIDINSSEVILGGNGNSIFATATGGSTTTGIISALGEAYGIYAQNSATLNIKNTAINTKITVNGSTSSWGILADSDPNTYLLLNDAVIDNANAYDALVTYTNLSAPGTGGNALEWQGPPYIKSW